MFLPVSYLVVEVASAFLLRVLWQRRRVYRKLGFGAFKCHQLGCLCLIPLSRSEGYLSKSTVCVVREYYFEKCFRQAEPPQARLGF